MASTAAIAPLTARVRAAAGASSSSSASSSSPRVVRAAPPKRASSRRRVLPLPSSSSSSSSSSRIAIATRASSSEISLIAQVALRDDYDPVVFLFCANALFLSVVINVVNYALDRDDDGNVSWPEGGAEVIAARVKAGMIDYFETPFKQGGLFKPPTPSKDLDAAVEELILAKSAAYVARGTDLAEEKAARLRRVLVHHTLVPIRPRRRGERRSLRTFARRHLSAQGPSVSIPTHLDAFQLRP